MELSKLAELNDSAGGYDWAWQKETKALQEKAEAAGGVADMEEDNQTKAALTLSVDNILMVRYLISCDLETRGHLLLLIFLTFADMVHDVSRFETMYSTCKRTLLLAVHYGSHAQRSPNKIIVFGIGFSLNPPIPLF